MFQAFAGNHIWNTYIRATFHVFMYLSFTASLCLTTISLWHYQYSQNTYADGVVITKIKLRQTSHSILILQKKQCNKDESISSKNTFD